jgi:molybdopterin converting factor small subunit
MMESVGMRVEVRLYAGARELAGTGSLTQSLSAGTTVQDLAETLYDAYPGLRDMRLRFAVNACYADPGTVLHDGDEVACIPPVGGG